jgi:hypothetical protein
MQPNMKLSKSNNYDYWRKRLDDYWVKKLDDNGQLSRFEFSNRHGSAILTLERLRELLGSDPLSMEELVRRIDREIGGEN